MAISDSNYEGVFTIPTPKGVYQAAGDTNVNVNYAYKALNMRTERGLLASGYGTSAAFPSLGAQIETLVRFSRRNQPEAGELFVAAAAGAIYTITPGEDSWTQRASGFGSNVWSTVTYEEAGDGATIDVLIMSNAEDGMIALRGDSLTVERKTLTIGDEFAAVKFAVLGRYAERIWGAGAEGYPDTLFYSRPYNPFDWTDMPETPELGGGMIVAPTWDGEAFIALAPFGGYLLAVKPSTVFEIRGTDPSSFTVTQGYGTDGPMTSRSICIDRMNMLFLSRGDIGLYNGSTLQLLSRDALYETMRMLGERSAETATACMCDHIYYLAVCVNEAEGDQIQENNAVIEYDTERGTFMMRSGIRVKTFYSLGGVIYYTDALPPYDVKRYNDPASGSYDGEAIPAVWQTPWLDLGKAYEKSEFELRFTAEAGEDDYPLRITIESEKRAKSKVILLSARRRDYKVKIRHRGVRIRMTMEASSRAAGFAIHGGVQVKYSIDAQ